MNPVSKKPAVLRDSWRPRTASGSRTRWTRLGRRVAITMLAVVLLGALFYALFSPFWHPNSHLIVATADRYTSPKIPPVEFAREDADALRKPLANALYRGAGDTTQTQPLRVPDDFAKLGEALNHTELRDSDVIIVDLHAHGVALNGEAFLLCEGFDAVAVQEGRYPLAKLLQQLRQLPNAVKLLILDAGRLDYDPRLGMIVSEFPRLLKEEVEKTGDPTLWVFSANSSLERSHVSRTLRQSVFGHFVSRGLSGEADLNADQLVDVNELYRYVRTNVSAWVQHDTAGNLRQSPQLICGGALPEDDKGFPVLLSASAIRGHKLKLDVKELPSLDKLEKDDKKEDKTEVPKVESKTTSRRSLRLEIQPVVFRETSDASPEAPNAKEPSAEEDLKPNNSNVGGGKAGSPVDAKIPVATPTDEATAAKKEVATDKAPLPLVPTAAMKADELIDLGRRLIDFAESRQGSVPTPVDFAPHWWRIVGERLVRNEYTDRITMDKRALEKTLRRWTKALSEVAQRQALTETDATLYRVESLRVPYAISPHRVRSWSLAERIATENRASLPPALIPFVKALEKTFSEDDRTNFDKLAAKEWPKETSMYDELEFARRLTRTGPVPWSTLKLAWQTCREGEQVAADPWSLVSGVRNTLSEADRLRTAGRRALFDQIGREWPSTAEQNFRQSLALYRDVGKATNELQLCWQLRNDLMQRAARYVRWYQAGAGDVVCSPRYEAVSVLLDTLASFVASIESPQGMEVGTLEQQRRLLLSLTEQVEAPLRKKAIDALTRPDAVKGGRRWRMDVLLESQLLGANEREQLTTAIQEMNEAEESPFVSPEMPEAVEFARAISPAEWLLPVRQAALDAKLGKLALIAGDDAPASPAIEASFNAAIANADQTVESFLVSLDEGKLWKGFRDTGARLAAVYEELPNRIQMVARKYRDLRDASQRDAAFRALRAAERLTRLVDERDVARFTDDEVLPILCRAVWFNRLLSQRQRFLTARADASPNEVNYLTGIAEVYRQLATEVPSQPAITSPPPATVTLDGPSEISLATEPQRDVEVSLRYLGDTFSPVWVMLEYDSELLEIKTPPDSRILDENVVRPEVQRRAREVIAEWERAQSMTTGAVPEGHEALKKRAEMARQATKYPLSPQLVDVPFTIQMILGDERRLQFTLRRKGTAARRTKLVVKAIADNFHLRHEIAVGLKSLETIALEPVGKAGSWSKVDEALVLHPLPNRKTDFEFQLVNQAVVPKNVTVEFFAPDQRSLANLSAQARLLPVSEQLTMLGPMRSLMRIDKLALPANGKPVKVTPPQIVGNPAESGADKPPETADPKKEAAARLEVNATAIPVRNGMLMVLQDQGTGDTLLQRIDFRPQRPRRFLQSVVGYNRALERIEVRVTALDPDLVPSSGCRVRCEFPESLPRGTEAQLEGIVKAPDYSALLYVQAPAGEGRTQTIYLNVDDYPRAFVYHVPCSSASTNVPEATDLMDVRISAPLADAQYQSSVSRIPVEFQVDAPVGAFESDKDVVEIGVDGDRDREFHNEPTVVLHTDRQAEVYLECWAAGGLATFSTRVHDFKLDIPSGGLHNLRASVLARIQAGPRLAWSRPVPIILDGAAPQISRVELRPGRSFAVAAELEVDVWAVDGDLSGVAKIEIGFDTAQTGKFDSESPPVPAKAVGQSLWTAKVPTDMLQPGSVTLLVQATDRVGNVSSFTKVATRVLSMAEAEVAGKGALARVLGTLRYAGTPIPKGSVTLVGEDMKTYGPEESDANGLFLVANVPAGKYKLTARGVSRNKPRKVETEIIVKAPPANMPRLELDLK